MNQDRPLGAIVENWTVPPRPNAPLLEGAYCRLEKLDPDRHAADLFAAYSADRSAKDWDYLGYGPFESLARFHRWIRSDALGDAPYFYAIGDKKRGRWAGLVAFSAIDPASGVIQIDDIHFSPDLQRTRVATEAIFLMMNWTFEAGYRRLEWRCDALNRKARRAAERLGFIYEGLQRQACVSKGRNCDLAWYAALDTEWLKLKPAFEFWLSASNFNGMGEQNERLWDLTRPVRVGSDPLRG